MEEVQRIFELLKLRGIQQKDFAKKIGISASKVSEWKSGKSKSYTDYWQEIADVLGVSTDYLLRGKESSPPSEKNELHRRIDLLTPENAQRLLGYLDSLEAQKEKP